MTNTEWYHLFVESKNKTNQCIHQNRNRHRYRKQTRDYQCAEGSEEKQNRFVGLGNTNFYV